MARKMLAQEAQANAGRKLLIVPIDRDRARRYVGENHRHSDAPRRSKFQVGLRWGDELIGVGFAGRPTARLAADGATIEITRVCVADGAPKNACSMIYGALCRAARALGYVSAITYTRADEKGVSLKAAGFAAEAEVKKEAWGRRRPGQQLTLVGQREPVKRKRWRRPC